MTAQYNAALVRYQGGHLYVDRSGSARQREVYVEMGGVSDADVAERIARTILDLYRAERVTSATSGQIRRMDQVPGVQFQLADKVDGAMVRSYTVALEGDGLVSVTPELDDPLEIRAAAINRQLQRAASGIHSEYARPNITPADSGAGTDTTPPEFSQSDAVAVSISPAWRAPRPWWCAWLDVQLGTAGSTPTTVLLAREVGSTWVTVATATLAAGTRRAIAVVDQGWQTGERLVVGTKVAGTGAKDLTATLRGTMV